jgi:hypothetical protein
MQPRLERWIWFLAAITVLAVLAGAACSSVPNGPHSSIVAAVVPPSDSTRDSASFVRPGHIEAWIAPGGYDNSVRTMRSQLPINGTLDGLLWCGSSTKSESTAWAWATSGDMIYVGVFETADGTMHITIERDPPTNGALNGMCTP